jgi:hypothetical protein
LHTLQVCQWIKRQGLDSLSIIFLREGIDGERLLELKAVTLHQMGVLNPSHQTTLLSCLDRLKSEARLTGEKAGVLEWTRDDVVRWLHRTDFAHLADTFDRFGVSGPLLLTITPEDLFRMFEGRLNSTQQNLLLSAISRLRSRKNVHSLRETTSTGRLSTQMSMDSSSGGPHSWNLTEVGNWLNAIQLPELRSVFMANSVSGASLMRLTPEDLDAMGITDLASRAAVLAAISDLKRGGMEAQDLGRLVRSFSAEDSMMAGDLVAGWARPHMLPSRAHVLLTGAPPGHFILHQAENSGHYELSYVNERGEIVMPGLRPRNSAGLLGTRRSAVGFSSFSEMVDHYAQEGTTDLDVTCALLPEASVMRLNAIDMPVASENREGVAEWDKRRDAGVDAARVLSARPSGSFFVLKGRELNQLALHVNLGQLIEVYPIVSQTDGGGYQLVGQNGVRTAVCSSLETLIELLQKPNAALPLPLQLFDVARSIRATIRRVHTATEEEDPWCWWQPHLDATEAEALLAGKSRGAFVIYPGSPDAVFPLVLAYKVGNSIKREEVYRTPATSRLAAGFHLARSQNRVGSSCRSRC